MKCHAQANSYIRTANAARSLLHRIQTAPRKRAALRSPRPQSHPKGTETPVRLPPSPPRIA